MLSETTQCSTKIELLLPLWFWLNCLKKWRQHMITISFQKFKNGAVVPDNRLVCAQKIYRLCIDPFWRPMMDWREKCSNFKFLFSLLVAFFFWFFTIFDLLLIIHRALLYHVLRSVIKNKQTKSAKSCLTRPK